MHYTAVMVENGFIRCCIPFFAAAVFHLSACAASKHRYADISKVILMPLLIAAVLLHYFLFGYRAADANFTRILCVCTALAAGAAGDIFLLGDVKPSTLAKGLCSFLAGHLIYIAALLLFVPAPKPPRVFVCVAAVLYAVAVYTSRILAGKPKGLTGIGVVLYGSVLSLFSFSVLIKTAGFLHMQPHSVSLMPLIRMYAGTALFIVSDSVLSRTVFFKPFFQSRFIVMLTYIGAQFFIAWGFCSL